MTTVEQICAHLEFLGYEIQTAKNDFMVATHKTYFNLTFKEIGFGILFYLFFPVNALGKSKEGDVLERINEFNSQAGVCRCFLDKDGDLMFKTYMPSVYEKTTFGGLIEQLNKDYGLIGMANTKLIEYLQ